ncbi:MAG: acyltransferase [Rhodobacteraceae bacterium]|nr:MAG: acyltransferase [Paracoccaceae bacterium]
MDQKDEMQLILEATGGDIPYKARDLTYASSFTNPFKRGLIRTIENLTGRLKCLYLIRKWERNANRNPNFWISVLDQMNIKMTTPKEQLDKIPKEGPILIVSNHPHGLVDGIVMAQLLSEVRDDYKILTRSLLCNVPRVEEYLLPVSFPHEPGAIQNNIQTRKVAINHLNEGGCVGLFPAGTVSTSDTFFGSVVEADWMPFTAKMINKSQARVVPVYFPGENSRLFQIANKLSTTLRQAFLLHEIAHACGKDQAPIVGDVIERDRLAEFAKDSKAMMNFLKAETLKLKTPA